MTENEWGRERALEVGREFGLSLSDSLALSREAADEDEARKLAASFGNPQDSADKLAEEILSRRGL